MKIKTNPKESMYDIALKVAKFLKKKGRAKTSSSFEYEVTEGVMVVRCTIESESKTSSGAIVVSLEESKNLSTLKKAKKDCYMLVMEDLGVVIEEETEEDEYDNNVVEMRSKRKSNKENNTRDSENDEEGNDDEHDEEYDEDDSDEDEEYDEEDRDDNEEENNEKRKADNRKKSSSNGNKVTREQKERWTDLLNLGMVKTEKRLGEVFQRVRERYGIEIYKKEDINKENADEVLDAIEELFEGYTF